VITALYHGYLAAFWPMLAMCAFIALWRADYALLRCVAVVIGGQLAIDLWFATHGAMAEQPWAAFLAVYALSAALLTIRPSGMLCSIMGGVMLAGALFSIIRGAFNWTEATDLLYWQVNVLLGWLTFAVLSGGATGERGRRVVTTMWRGLIGMVIPSHRGGVA
jgi:hypothetical protein